MGGACSKHGRDQKFVRSFSRKTTWKIQRWMGSKDITLSLGSIQPSIQWVPEAPSLRVKRPRREADRSPPTNAEVKRMYGAIPPLPNTHSWCGTVKKKSTGTTLPLPVLTTHQVVKTRLFLDERIILKWILEKQVVKMWIGFI